MRIRYLVLILLVAAIAAAPFVSGLIMQRSYIETMAVLDANRGIKVTLTDYKLGWLKSTVKLTVAFSEEELSQLPPGTPNFSVSVTDTITHGPIIYDPIQKKWTLGLGTIKTNLDIPPMLNALLSSLTMAGQAKLNTVVTLDKRYIAEYNIPNITVQLPEMGKFVWQGLQGDSYFKVTNAKEQSWDAKVNLTLGAVSAQMDSSTFNTKDVTIHSQVAKQALGLYSGYYSFVLPEIAIIEPKGNVNLKNFEMTHTFGIEKDNNNFYSISTEASLNQLNVADFLINPSTLKISVHDIKAPELAAFLDIMKKLPQGTKDLTPEQAQAIQSKLPLLIGTTTGIKEEVNVATSLGNIVSDGIVYWPQAPQTLQDLMTFVSFKFNLKISAALLDKIVQSDMTSTPTDQTQSGTTATPTTGASAQQQAQELINDWIKQGFIIKQGNDYITSITREQGVIKINGITFDPSKMAAMMPKPLAALQHH